MIQLDRDARGVLTIALARPEAKNALNLEMVRGMRAALAETAGLRAVVVRSLVPGVFSLGMDLGALQAGMAGGATSPQVYEAVKEYADLLKDLVALRCPSIAEVSGMAIGGGVDLLAACDLAFASKDAAFSIAQLRKGIFPLTTSGVVIPRIGQREFLFWLLSGQNYSAEKARGLHLVNAVYPPAELRGAVDRFVATILRYDADALRLAPDLPPAQRLDHLGALLALNCQIPRNKGDS